MKMPKIMRPIFEFEIIGVKGFLAALYAICRAGIKKAYIDCQFKKYTINSHGFIGGKVKRHYFYIIPKYKFKRVSELSENPVKIIKRS